MKSIVSKVAGKMVEINSRLSNINGGLIQLAIRTAKGKVQLREMTMKSDFGTPTSKLMIAFPDYPALYEYIIVLNAGLKLAGLNLYEPTIISHKHGFKSFKGKDIAYRLFKGEIEVIAVVNDTITDYTTLESLEMDTQLSWSIPDAHLLLGIK